MRVRGWAMKLGKNVYCEKPVCHDVSEARRLREAARQVGWKPLRNQGLRKVHHGFISAEELQRLTLRLNLL